jgi:hypothetical protein
VRIPGDGAAELQLICRPAQGCSLAGGVGGIEEENPASGPGSGPGIVLPQTDPLAVAPGPAAPPPVAPPLVGYLLGAIMVAGVLVSLLYQRRPGRREVGPLGPE